MEDPNFDALSPERIDKTRHQGTCHYPRASREVLALGDYEYSICGTLSEYVGSLTAGKV